MSSLYEEVKCTFCGAALSTDGLCPNQYQHTRQRLDAEAATAEGCSRCGFMALTGHDCPELDAPTDAALPGEVERCEHCGGPRAHTFCPMRFCSLCGGYYDFRGDHADCQPFDAKILEVLRHMEDAGLSWQSDTLRTHIAALTAERDALRAEVVRLNSVGAAKTSTIAALCDTADEIELQARIEALEWAAQQKIPAHAGIGRVIEVLDLERVEREIARLRGQEKPQ